MFVAMARCALREFVDGVGQERELVEQLLDGGRDIEQAARGLLLRMSGFGLFAAVAICGRHDCCVAQTPGRCKVQDAARRRAGSPIVAVLALAHTSYIITRMLTEEHLNYLP